MNNFLLDTNILIRVITNDDIELSPKAKNILVEAEKQGYKLILTPMVIAECVYVLTSPNLYNLNREKAVLAINVIINVKNVILLEKNVTLQSLEYYQTTDLDFADCYLLAKAKIDEYTGIKTFDKGI